jgi:phosphoglycolate phosphatase-like HAD superfamily hydrolase
LVRLDSERFFEGALRAGAVAIFEAHRGVGRCARGLKAAGFLLVAAREPGIDLSASWMIGDRWRDIDCGAAAGCRTIFTDYGYDEPLRTQPDFRATSLREATAIVLAAG